MISRIKHKRIKTSKPAKNYIDNDKFLAALIEYKKSVKEALDNGQPRPKIPDYIGECFLELAKNISYSGKFINYSFRDDLIADSAQNCVRYIDNFDPNISLNPFAYFTQMVMYAFIKRIKLEKKQTYIKFKTIDIFDVDSNEEYKDLIKTYCGSAASYRKEFINKYETSLKQEKKKKKKVEKTSLELMMEK